MICKALDAYESIALWTNTFISYFFQPFQQGDIFEYSFILC